MHIDFLINIFEKNTNTTAIIWKDQEFNYEWLLNRISYWEDKLAELLIRPGDLVALIGDFSPECVAVLLSLIENENIIIPLNNGSKSDYSEKYRISQAEKAIFISEFDTFSVKNFDVKAKHPFYTELRLRKVAGLVLFTSGTSGTPKGAVHDFTRLLEKFKTPRRALKTVNFLMFDHWGGLNTMFHTLSNAGVVLTTKDRSPDAICAFIQKHHIELLPASPTFFNLMLMSESYLHFDLSSLQIMSYGTEPMPEFTLKKLKSIFPNIKLQQTYGLIELGVLRTKSKSDDSLWVKVGGSGYQTRVVDGILQIKADSAMLGYLNAPSPFTDDGWFITGDSVEVNGEYLKILGRKSELINVGGEKVYPQEVENIILELGNVREVTVYGEKNTIIGNIVCANVTLKEPEEKKEFISRLKKHCFSRMKSFMIPVKINILENTQYNERFKKIRST
ncbi:MAG: AMP-binding protein [Bacteroidetes bacterium]|nr:AMP-binding protein [Bacteroidota bacterium]